MWQSLLGKRGVEKKKYVIAPTQQSQPDQKTTNESTPLYARLLDKYGVLMSSAAMSHDEKVRDSLYLAYRERAEIALHVAYAYPGGDYFEFGSDGMGTFRNFLTAFDLNELDQRFPDTQFYAFDIFGDMGTKECEINTEDINYFRGYVDNSKYEQAQKYVVDHGLFLDKCHLMRGFFQDTMNQSFRNRLRASGRTIGFAFLDCNITSSYIFCLDAIFDFLKLGTFLYMDEYFMNKEVPALLEQYQARLKEKGLRTLYIRNAGTFGALFLLSPA